MWFPIAAWIVLLSASAFFLRATLGLDLAQLSVLPSPQRIAIGAIIFTTLSLVGSSAWQTYSLGRRNKLLRDRLRGFRQGATAALGTQNQFDAAVQHLVDNDPEEAIASLQKTLTETEQRAALQQGRSESVDMRDRLDDIRRRQLALREMIGEVADKRRVIEPVFGELRDRQRQLERSLTELETDDGKNNLAVRLNELDHDVSSILARKNLLQESLATLNRFKEELGKCTAELAALRAPETGIGALIAELRISREQLTVALDEVESSGDEKLASRVESLSRNKIEIEQRVARVEDGFNILDAIRLDFEELGERRSRLERALAEVETDASGKSLVDRQNTLKEFIVQSRLRLGRLQDSSVTLNQFKEALAKSQAELAPLQAPVFGIEALIGEVNTNRDLLIKTLGEIEFKGDQKLSSRVEAIANNKVEVDARLARVFENFQKLDSMRKDIGEIFTNIRGTLNRIG
jgi:predicted  nucleic acid-binding Zn-ribbon protein